MSAYKLETPGVISFSGGRTSGYMLRKILDEYDNKLPEDLPVVFSNTGKEMPQTLDFVQECSDKWNVPIVWIEWNENSEHNLDVVNYETASRKGEPFERLIDSKAFLPNPVTRYCTSYLKIKAMRAYCMFWKDFEYWNNYVGLRYDERHRVARIHNRKKRERWETEAPLHAARVTVHDVFKFWTNNDFDLRLPNIGGKTPQGNCDMCFLKGKNTIMNIMKSDPKLADWWIAQEEKKIGGNQLAHKFRKDRASYRGLLEQTQNQLDLFEYDQSTDTCFCHD
jgi:3'-phosphoadenosine 5'-phosphosulfate sulfotransferase (PAPS reductase)/FAD synthetase